MIDTKQSLLALFFIALFVLCLPYFFRFTNDNHVFIGSESHYHARMASEIIKHGFITKDPLLNIRYKPNPYHFVLAGAGFIVSLEFVSIILPVLLGLLTVLFLYLFFSAVKFNYLRSWFVLLVFILSPLFISVFSLSTPRALALALFAIGMFLFTRKSKILFGLSLLSFVFLSLISITDLIVVLLVLFMYCSYTKKAFNRFYISLVVLLILLIGFHLPFYLTEGITSSQADGLISDLGSIYGFSIFSLLLAVIGLFFVWRYKKALYKLYLFMIVLLFFSFITKSLFIYTNVFISILAGSAFYVLCVKKWHLKQLRTFALLVIFCGFLFAALAHTVFLSELPPSDKLVECLEQSSEITPDNSLFLTSAKDGFFTEFWADRSVFINEFYAPDKRVYSADMIWDSWDIREVRLLLSENNIDYILIHEDLFQGQLWDKKEQGLHFLLNNAETFKRRYHNDYCELWEYVYGGGING